MTRSDKGKKRKSYDMGYRNQKKLFADLKRTADEMKDTRRGERRGRPRHQRRKEAREKLLPKDRLCPMCKQPKLKSRQWVIVRDAHGYVQSVLCKSCFMKGGSHATTDNHQCH